MRFPNTVDELIRELDLRYPEVSASPGDDPQTVFQAALQRGVINDIKRWRAGVAIEPPVPRQRGKGRHVPR